MQRTITGLRIRERRRELGVKQIDLAARVGVSASYLNLIESNKRGIGGALLAAIGRELSLTVDQLDGSAEQRLREQLRELAADPETGDPEMGRAAAEEFIARFPAWARGAARAYAGFREAAAEADAMADRLANDPALGTAIHAMLTEIAALRSTSEILAEGGELSPDQRRRFEQIVFEQSSRLADTGAALAAYFDDTAEARRRRSPAVEAEETLAAAKDLNAAIEAIAEDARDRLDRISADLEAALAEQTVASLFADDAQDRDPREMRIAALSKRFVRQRLPEAIKNLSETVAAGASEAARILVEDEIVLRVSDAIRRPRADFAALCVDLDWDVAAIARALEGDAALAMRRIACLAHPLVPRAAHISADASGAVLSRRGALDLLPRTRALDCPVWPIHRVNVEGALAAEAAFGDGNSVIVAAMAGPDGMTGEMIVTDPSESRMRGQRAGAPKIKVGPDCRICAHETCRWRREAAVISR